MNTKKALLQILSVVLITLLTLHVPFTYAQEATPTPTEELVSPTPLPTPTDSPTHTSENQNTIDETETYTFGYPTPATGSATVNTGDDAELITSDSELLDVKVTTDNDTVVERDTEVDNTSGTNTVVDNISLSGPITLDTGDSDSRATVSTVVNTNVVGLNVQPIIHNLYTPQNTDLSLAGVQSCQSFDEAVAGDIEFNENTGNNVQLLSGTEIKTDIGVYTTNKATINNEIDLDSNTGDNTATDNIGIGVHVTTGDATSTAYLSNVTNTNLIGNCGVFAVINLFEGGTGSIILPYENGYMGGEGSSSTSSTIANTGNNSDFNTNKNKSLLIDVTATNSATLSTNVNATTETGTNSITDAIAIGGQIGIDTGNNYSQIETIDMANLNFIDSNFVYLKINHNGHFKGQITGWDGEIFVYDDYFILYKKPSSPTLQLASESESILDNTGDNLEATSESQFDQIYDIEADNDATITNDITLNAKTGGNTAGRFGATIETGDATTKAGIFNLANTNIIGNNWYVAFINIFDDFFGNIIFPRPDLALYKSVNRSSARVGDTLAYSLKYQNTGQVMAKDAVITDTLPAGLEYVSSNVPVTPAGSTLNFRLGDVVSNQSGEIIIVVRITDKAAIQIINTANISTTTTETNKTNNESSAFTSQSTDTPQSSPTASAGVTIVTTPTPTLAPIRIANNTITFPESHGGLTLGQSSDGLYCTNPLSCMQGSILDGISTTAKAIPVTAILFYCLGVLTSLLIFKRFTSLRTG